MLLWHIQIQIASVLMTAMSAKKGKSMEKKLTSAFGWKFLERASVQGTNFLVTLLLARLLSPSDYGIVSIVMIFVTLATILVQGGFNTALIQKKDVSADDYFTILIFSEFVASITFIIIFFSAPFIGKCYHSQELSSLLRVMAVVLFPGAFNSVQVAYITRDLRFKVLTKSTLAASLIAAVVAISMAFSGFGVWALIAQQLIYQTMTCVVTYCIIRWTPRGHFSFQSLKRLLPFGSKVFASNFITALFLDIRGLIIGRVYSSDALGYFNRGKQFPQAVMESVNTTIQTVLLPVYSKKQDSLDNVTEMVSKTLRLSSLILFPMMIGLSAVAEPLVSLLLTDKWLPCVPYLRIFSICYLFQAVQIPIIQSFKGIGDSSTPLKLEIAKKAVELILLLSTIKMGLYPFALSLLAASVFSQVLNTISAKKVIRYDVFRQIRDIAPATGFSIVMGACIMVVIRLINNNALRLLVGIVGGIVVYFLLCILFRIPELELVKSSIVKLRKGKQ